MIKLPNGTYLGTNRRRLDLGSMHLIETVYNQPVFTGWHSHEQAKQATAPSPTAYPPKNHRQPRAPIRDAKMSHPTIGTFLASS